MTAQSQQNNVLANDKVRAQSQPVQPSSQQTTWELHHSSGFLRRFFSKSKRLTIRLWPHIRPAIGYPFIYLGVLLMVVFYFTNLTNYNLLLFLPLLLITVGIIGKVALK